MNFLHSLSAWWVAHITIPTYVTLMRIVFVPFIIMSLLANNLVVASVLFVLAALTDVIDGALARSLNAVSEVGTFLDPLADKLLLTSCYACLTYSYFSMSGIPVWFLVLVILNELILAAGAVYRLMIKKTSIMPATKLGKMASFGQILFIGWLFVCGLLHVPAPFMIMQVLLVLIVAARLCTLLQYGSMLYKQNVV